MKGIRAFAYRYPSLITRFESNCPQNLSDLIFKHYSTLAVCFPNNKPHITRPIIILGCDYLGTPVIEWQDLVKSNFKSWLSSTERRGPILEYEPQLSTSTHFEKISGDQTALLDGRTKYWRHGADPYCQDVVNDDISWVHSINAIRKLIRYVYCWARFWHVIAAASQFTGQTGISKTVIYLFRIILALATAASL